MSSVELLIEEVRKHGCLWNKSLESYRNQNIRDNAWERTSKELKKPVEDLKHDWKKLQDCYRQAMLRRKTKSGQSATKTKPWKYEELMSFLASDTLPRSTQSNVDDDGDENSNSLEPTEANDETQGQHAEEENPPEDNQPNYALQGPSQRYKKGLKVNIKNAAKEDYQVDKVISFLTKKENNKKPLGELDYFFASACESTKGLPRYLQLRIKQEIMTSIIGAEIEYLHSRPQSSASSATNISARSPMLSPQSDVSQQQYDTLIQTRPSNPWSNTQNAYGQSGNTQNTHGLSLINTYATSSIQNEQQTCLD